MNFFLVMFLCLFNLSLMAQNKTLDDLLEKHKGKSGISEIKALLDEGINAKDKFGSTALIMASAFGYTDIAVTLISHHFQCTDAERAGADTYSITFSVQTYVNIKDEYGWTALIWASAEGYTDIVVTLIEARADVNIKNNDGYTALMLASQNGHTKVVRLLKEAGAKE